MSSCAAHSRKAISNSTSSGARGEIEFSLGKKRGPQGRMSFASLRLLIGVFAISVVPVQPNSSGMPPYTGGTSKRKILLLSSILLLSMVCARAQYDRENGLNQRASPAGWSGGLNQNAAAN